MKPYSTKAFWYATRYACELEDADPELVLDGEMSPASCRARERAIRLCREVESAHYSQLAHFFGITPPSVYRALERAKSRGITL